MRTRDLCAVSGGHAIAYEVPPFTVSVSRDAQSRVVHVGGELDVATRHLVRRACLSGRRKTVVVEMSKTTFMDCSGYGGLVAARRVLQQHGGSLTLRNQTGQPAALLAVLATIATLHPGD